WRSRPKVPPACDCEKPPPGCSPDERTPVEETVGSALFRVVDGTAKFAKLKMLKISVRNSRFVDSVIAKRLLSTRSNCRKFGPRRALRGKSPKVPGIGIENAAGLIM